MSSMVAAANRRRRRRRSCEEHLTVYAGAGDRPQERPGRPIMALHVGRGLMRVVEAARCFARGDSDGRWHRPRFS